MLQYEILLIIPLANAIHIMADTDCWSNFNASEKFAKIKKKLVLVNEPNLKLRHKQKNGHVSRGTLVTFVWATIGQKFLTRCNSTKNEDIVL